MYCIVLFNIQNIKSKIFIKTRGECRVCDRCFEKLNNANNFSKAYLTKNVAAVNSTRHLLTIKCNKLNQFPANCHKRTLFSTCKSKTCLPVCTVFAKLIIFLHMFTDSVYDR